MCQKPVNKTAKHNGAKKGESEGEWKDPIGALFQALSAERRGIAC